MTACIGDGCDEILCRCQRSSRDAIYDLEFRPLVIDERSARSEFEQLVARLRERMPFKEILPGSPLLSLLEMH